MGSTIQKDIRVNTDFKELSAGKKIYFASDFHLGAPDHSESLAREKKIIRWLDTIENDAGAIILVGDIFDFWFEYNNVIPMGFIRFQGKIAELREKNIPIIFFTGNHDMWMFDYFPRELGIPVYNRPVNFQICNQSFFVGHGDGLGPGDHFYKFLKGFFSSGLCQWMFKWLHPNVGVWLAKTWSNKSRHKNAVKDAEFLDEEEYLLQFIRSNEKQYHYDAYLFGHRHLPLDIEVEKSRYINLGEWIKYCTYASFDGEKLLLEKFEDQ